MTRLAPGRPRVLFLTPIIPAPTGNGLAMRAALAVDGLARSCRLATAVVPISDPQGDPAAMAWVAERSERAVLVPLEEPAEAARGWLGAPSGRRLATVVGSLPARARGVSPGSGLAARELLGRDAFDAVWLLRLYMVGAIVPFLELLPRPRLILDSDDDDEATLASIAAVHARHGDTAAAEGARAESEAYGRLAAHCLSWFDRVLAASPADARSLAARHGLETTATLPNAVPIGPPRVCTRDFGEAPNLVFVGNCDYAPNRHAVERLALRILPAIREKLPGAGLRIVGAGGGERVAGLGRRDGVTVHGALRELDEVYRDADLAVIPLEAGGGSRLKILELFANGIPVVSTPEGVAGLDVDDGRELLVAADDQGLVAATVRVATEPGLAARLTTRASEFVAREHDRDRITRELAVIAGLVD